MPWHLSVERRAARDLAALPAADRERVAAALWRLADDPGSVDLVKLGDGQWRMRVGRWRVLLEMDNVSGTITVARIRPRNEQTYR